MTPDGGFLYAGGRSKPAIHAFKVQGETESLAVVGKHTTSIVFPRDFTMSPSGQHLIVANEPKPGMPSNLVVLKIGPTGELNNVGQPTAAPGSSFLGPSWAEFAYIRRYISCQKDKRVSGS